MIAGCIEEKHAFQKALFNRYAGKMMSVCLRYANDPELAQDILQEGFIRLFKYIHQYRNEGSFEGWMRRIFANTAIRIIKKNVHVKATDISLMHDQPVDPSVLSKMSEDEIHAMIRSMPDGYRMIFNLSVIEGYSHEEIASLLQIEAGTSRGQLFKARKYLQQLINKKYKAIII